MDVFEAKRQRQLEENLAERMPAALREPLSKNR
jgi:hypothetical protein